MALTFRSAASLNKLRSRPDIGAPKRDKFENSKAADAEFSKAIDEFYPGLDESESDGAPGEEGILRYNTSQGERIQVLHSGDSKSGEYIHEWVGGGFLYTAFDENSIDNYQVMPQGTSHLHIDRQNPENSYVEHGPGLDLLSNEEAPTAPAQVESSELIAKDGMQYAILKEGTGAEKADVGENVLVHYSGFLDNGERFDSSLAKKRPFTFQLGAGGVIQGWEKGVEGMAVGEKRLLKIPPHMGYGERGAGDRIPPNSPLTFEVELLATDSDIIRP